MAISDELVVLRKDNTILAESFDGKQLGSFRVKPLTKCSTWIEVIDRNRFYLDGCGKAWTVDLSGRKLVHLQPPTGWGVRHGWSADGKRILFDHYIRSVPFWEAFTDAIFLNDYTPSTGEVVRVQYTTNGGICFEWGDPKHLVGEGDYHADISPSGRYVALVTGGFLSIYRLAEECSKK